MEAARRSCSRWLGIALMALMGLEPGACRRAVQPKDTTPMSPGTHSLVLDSAGTKVEYNVSGQGPICVVYPGGPGLNWQYLRVSALERQFTMVYFQPPGSGHSTRYPPGSYSFERILTDLEAFVSRLGLDHFYLMGHSWGGIAAQEYAIAHSSKLAGLILYSTSSHYDAGLEAAMMENVKRLAAEPWHGDAMRAVEELGRITASTSDAQGTRLWRRAAPLEFAHYGRRRAAIDAYLDTIEFAVAPNIPGAPHSFDIDLRPSLRAIHVPTLIIAGALDVICGPGIARELVAGIEGSRLAILEDSSHFGHVEEPDGFARVVREFADASVR